MRKRILFIALSTFILFACNDNKLEVDISSVDLEPLQTLRLEEDLFKLNLSNFDENSKTIKTKYGMFYEHFLINPLGLNGTKDTAYKAMVLDFVSDKNVREAYDYTKKMYSTSEFENISEEVNNCVKRFKYHFPKRKLPTRFITCTTGWNYAFAYLDSALVVSLDMYLGDTAKFYQMLRYPMYQTRKMNKAHLLSDIARGWILTEFDNDLPQNTLLNHTIFYGKLYYAVNALLPNTNDSLIIGYSSKQMKACKEYEKNYWSYFAEKNRLYENNLNTIRELTSEGPFTGAISKECPPRIAMWIGWQIVKSYMKNNNKVTLQELMEDANAQKILSKSKYRP
ncbi:gliding motility lipoprotein GldB [Aurantibacillus circumpalustris]|uniref:gliding motility lipoprotein GldB n=1 Tax=Aurantibacillus circumpalustris TaxID=3036359 RepID=UPI00295B2856|nr:hypothetical protein [Aurantibacillus circumpalustris]